MELTKQERGYEKSVAEDHLSLALGLFATALIANELWQILPLVICGVAFLLSSIYIYLASIRKCKRTKILEQITTVRIKHVTLFLGLTLLGIGLIQKGGVVLILLGEICIGIAYGILISGILRIIIEARRRRRRIREVKAERQSS